MDLTLLISAFLTLFVIIDPIAVAPLFMALTTGIWTPNHRRAAAIPRHPVVAAGVLTRFRRLRRGDADLCRHRR